MPTTTINLNDLTQLLREKVCQPVVSEFVLQSSFLRFATLDFSCGSEGNHKIHVSIVLCEGTINTRVLSIFAGEIKQPFNAETPLDEVAQRLANTIKTLRERVPEFERLGKAPRSPKLCRFQSFEVVQPIPATLCCRAFTLQQEAEKNDFRYLDVYRIGDSRVATGRQARAHELVQPNRLSFRDTLGRWPHHGPYVGQLIGGPYDWQLAPDSRWTIDTVGQLCQRRTGDL